MFCDAFCRVWKRFRPSLKTDRMPAGFPGRSCELYAMIRKLLFLLFIPLTLSATAQDSVVRQVTVEEFVHLRDSLPDAVVIDLRTPEEVKQGKIPGAQVIDFFGPDFEASIESLDRNKVYLLYCASGGRSGETATHMKELGFKHIYEMPAGYNGWKKVKRH